MGLQLHKVAVVEVVGGVAGEQRQLDEGLHGLIIRQCRTIASPDDARAYSAQPLSRRESLSELEPNFVLEREQPDQPGRENLSA
jgi:hypothetical protein